MTRTLERVQPSRRRSGHIGTILLDGLVLVVLGIGVGLAWGFDVAFPHEPDQSAHPTLFAHMRRTTADDVPAAAPVIAQNDLGPNQPPENPQAAATPQPELQKPDPAPPENGGDKIAAAPPATQAVAAAPKADDLAQTPRPALNVTRPPPKVENKVEFFGVKENADTVAFVMDCSSSMAGSRFWRARHELMDAIKRLDPGQKFYVIFFSSGPVMLFPNVTPQLEDAGVVEKARTLRALPRILPIGDTYPEQSVQIAASLNPDLIYLMSDGEFDPLNDRLVRQIKAQGTKVHTIALESDQGRFQLEQLARTTGGTYRFIPPRNLSVDPYDQVMADFAFDLVDQLGMAQPDKRAKIREALATLASQDFGPQPGDNPDQVAAAVKRWRQWALSSLVPTLQNLPDADLLELINRSVLRYQVAALQVAAERHVDAPETYIDAMKRDDPDVVQAAREALLAISRFVDYGPDPGADDAAKARAIAGWQRWLQIREQAALMVNWTSDKLVRELGDSSPIHRQAAVRVIVNRQMKLADALFPLLHDPDEETRNVVATVLPQYVTRDGLGPKLASGEYLMEAAMKLLDGDNADERAAARQMLREVAKRPVSSAIVPASAAPKDWREWWNAEKDARAEQHFTLAKRLYDQKKMKAALLRFREIEKDYPGTKTAQLAHDLAEDAQRAVNDGK